MLDVQRAQSLPSAVASLPAISSVRAEPAAMDAVQPRTLKRGFRDSSIFDERGKAQNIAANRIRNFDRNRGRRQFAHVARIPEMLDQFRAHTVIQL